MPGWIFRWICCVFIGLLILEVSTIRTLGQPQTPTSPFDFQPPFERGMNAGEKHTYPVRLKANDFLKLDVVQKGIDVVVRLLGPDRKVMVEVDSPNGSQGAEPMMFIAPADGSYLLEIESPAKTSQSGTYVIEPEHVVPATEQDRTLVEIDRLIAQAQGLTNSGKFDQALMLSQQAVEKSEKVFGPEHRQVAESLNSLAIVHYSKGEYDQAAQLFERSVAIKEKALGANHQSVGEGLNNLATVYFIKGDYARAEALFLRVVPIWEAVFGPEHANVASTINNLAFLYKSKAEFAKAEPLYLRSLAIKEKIFGLNHPEVAQALNNLAVLNYTRGDFKKAEPLYAQALAIWEKAFGPDHPSVADGLNNLASLYDATGEYTQSEPLKVRVLAIREKALGPAHPDVATSLNNLGGLYKLKGDYARAASFVEKSLAIWEKALGPDHPLVATNLNNLAEIYQKQGNFQKAEPLYLRALAIREKVLGKDHPNVAFILSNLASFYFRSKGDAVQAEPMFIRALAIYEKAYGADHPDLATSLQNLAYLYVSTNRLDRAEPLYQRALAIREKLLGPNHPDVAATLQNLAGLYQAKGDVTQAVDFQTRANDVTERDLVRNLVSGSERQKLLYLHQTDKDTNLTISLNVQDAPNNLNARKTALTLVLRRKGRALDALASAIETLRRQQTPETQRLLDEYAALASQISALTLRGPGQKKPEDHQALIRSLEEQKEKLENDIGQRSKEFQAQTAPIKLESVQKQIPARALLLEYAVYQPFDPKTGKSGESRYVVYTLDQKGNINFADLGPAERIDQSAASLHKALSSPKAALETKVTPAAQELDRLVVQPIRALIGKANQLLISPDGALSLIPFAALADDKGRFLLESHRLTYLTSGRDLLRLAVKLESRTAPVILADPDYAEGKGPLLAGKQFAPLARLVGTKLEGRSLKTLFPNAEIKMQADATEAALKQIQRPELLHIATHGQFLDARAVLPASEDEKRLGITVDVEKLKVENPLLRSWLFFAGANHGGSDENDGTLTALEAAQLDLWGTKLVVLSACETGVGEAKTGDGVYGLRRALVLAGSEAQLMSLWSVSDRATRELMVDYYTRLKAGEGRSDALRRVQLKMLNDPKRRHPFYWASFIQSGEWANLAGTRKYRFSE